MLPSAHGCSPSNVRLVPGQPFSVQASALIGRRVVLALDLGELGQLVAAIAPAHRGHLVAAGRPRSGTSTAPTTPPRCTTLPFTSDGWTDTSGSPSERAIPATVRGCSESLNSDTVEEILCSMLVGTARTWRGSRPPPSLGARTGGGGFTGAGQEGEDGSARRGDRAGGAGPARAPARRTSARAPGIRPSAAPRPRPRLVASRTSRDRACCGGGRTATGAGQAGRSTRRTRGPRPRGPSRRAGPATCTARTPIGARRR